MNQRALPQPKKSNVQINAYVKAANRGLQAQHVVRNSEGDWLVKRADASRASKSFSTQKDAEVYARGIAKKNKTELFIHGRDGLIRDRSSYGSDPFPPKA
jgi:hypothetical protein